MLLDVSIRREVAICCGTIIMNGWDIEAETDLLRRNFTSAGKKFSLLLKEERRAMQTARRSIFILEHYN